MSKALLTLLLVASVAGGQEKVMSGAMRGYRVLLSCAGICARSGYCLDTSASHRKVPAAALLSQEILVVLQASSLSSRSVRSPASQRPHSARIDRPERQPKWILDFPIHGLASEHKFGSGRLNFLLFQNSA